MKPSSWLVPVMMALVGCSSVQKGKGEAMSPIHVIGHRGAAAYAPENTLESFHAAHAMGLYEVELDIQMSKDGRLVLFHDDVLDKKTAAKGRVRDHDWSVLKDVEIGKWFDRERGVKDRKFEGTNISLLSDLFDAYGKKFYYHVEIKTEDERMPSVVVAELRSRELAGSYTITSFYKQQLVGIRALDSNVPICYLIDDQKTDVEAAIREAKASGFTQVGVRAPAMNARRVELARSLGLRIRGWGVKTPEDMDRVLASGAEGMTIDWPDWLIRRILRKSASPL